jgi:hypothetical protein
MISVMIMAIVHRHPDAPMTATYGASVTKKLRIWLISIFVALTVPLVGVIGIAYMINGEEICLDRHPGGDRRRAALTTLALATSMSGCIQDRLSTVSRR